MSVVPSSFFLGEYCITVQVPPLHLIQNSPIGLAIATETSVSLSSWK